MSQWVNMPSMALFASMFLLIWTCPFTKVEESFNMQAMHDLLEYLPLSSFDHLEFPGVVPRTFLGALAISVVVAPFHYFLTTLLGVTKMVSQYLVRIVLGSFLWASFVYFANALNRKFGQSRDIGGKFLYLSALQFHVPFYMSRTLPNTFALAGCLISYTSWLDGRPVKCLCIMVCFMIIFRCDLLVMLAPLALQMLLGKEVPFFGTILYGGGAIICALMLTTAVDSFFWRRWVWPEGIVLFYNTVENKSSNWGVLPWHWYVTSALPRSLNISAGFAILGLLKSLLTEGLRSDRETLAMLYYSCPAVSFVFLYSFLPHKELRFIFPALPLLTALAAKSWGALQGSGKGDKMKPGQKKDTFISTLANATQNCLVLLGICFYFLFLISSHHNYPGGIALRSLHRNHIRRVGQACSASHDVCDAGGRVFKVHIDPGAAMTGVTRFGQTQPTRGGLAVSYSKEENLPASKETYRDFDWLIHADVLPAYLSNFRIVETIEAFDGIELNLQGAWQSLQGMLAGTICPIRIFLLAPITLRKVPKIWILQNMKLNM